MSDIALSDEEALCANPSECCRWLSKVWSELGVSGFTGKSVVEHIADLQAENARLRAAKPTDYIQCVTRLNAAVSATIAPLRREQFWKMGHDDSFAKRQEEVVKHARKAAHEARRLMALTGRLSHEGWV